MMKNTCKITVNASFFKGVSLLRYRFLFKRPNRNQFFLFHPGLSTNYFKNQIKTGLLDQSAVLNIKTTRFDGWFNTFYNPLIIYKFKLW